jgi:hypothetical protein
MAQEYLLAVAGLALLGAATLGVRDVIRYRRRRHYEPRHTGEQPRTVVEAEHQGATEQWSPLADIGPSGPVDPHAQLTNARAQIAHWQRQAERWQAVIATEDGRWVHTALDRMERDFRTKLSRTGRHVHLEADTAEWRRSDIRRPARSGAPR